MPDCILVVQSCTRGGFISDVSFKLLSFSGLVDEIPVDTVLDGRDPGLLQGHRVSLDSKKDPKRNTPWQAFRMINIYHKKSWPMWGARKPKTHVRPINEKSFTKTKCCLLFSFKWRIALESLKDLWSAYDVRLKQMILIIMLIAIGATKKIIKEYRCENQQ